MTVSRPSPTPELESLLIACIEGGCDEAQSRRMVELVGEDPAMLIAYVESMRIHAMLQWRYSAQPNGQPLDNLLAGMPLGFKTSSETSQIPSVEISIPAPAIALPVVDAPSHPIPVFAPTFHDPVGHFSSGWPVAYLIATVIFGVALTIAALVHVSHPGQQKQFATQSANPQSLIPNPSTVVGRITGMVDCVWEGSGHRVQGSGELNLPSPSGGHHEVVGAGGEGRARRIQSLIPNPQSLVSLGDTFALRSGLLELTYDSGAKVILQGPVTYEVESPSGGYLSIGKLTAKLEKKSLPLSFRERGRG